MTLWNTGGLDMLLVCYGLAQFVEMFLGFWVFQKLYPDKSEHVTWKKILFFTIYVGWGILAIWNGWMAFVSNSFVILNSLVLAGWIALYLKNSYALALIWEFFYNTTLALIKVLLLVLEGVLERETIYGANWGSRNFKEIIWCFTIYIIIFIVVFVQKNAQQVLRMVLFEHRKMLCIVCCAEWSMLTYSMYLGKRGFSTEGFVLHSVFVLCAVLVFLYLIWYVLYQQVKVEKSRLDTFQNMLEKQNQTLQMMYDQNSKKMHDVKHMMMYLENCLEQGKMREAQEQIQNYTSELSGMEQKVWTGFSFLDFILNYKKAEMDEKKIAFKLDVELYNIPLEEEELGIVLGNLFDNAIEAASQCELKKRNIYLKIGNMNQMFLLCMTNSSIKLPRLKNGRFLTTKEDSYAHGLGVESVKRIVKKQNGSINFQYDEEHFEVTILI